MSDLCSGLVLVSSMESTLPYYRVVISINLSKKCLCYMFSYFLYNNFMHIVLLSACLSLWLCVSLSFDSLSVCSCSPLFITIFLSLFYGRFVFVFNLIRLVFKHLHLFHAILQFFNVLFDVCDFNGKHFFIIIFVITLKKCTL